MEEYNSNHRKTIFREPVTWTVFTWTIGIIFVLFGWLINSDRILDSKVEAKNAELSAKIDAQNGQYLEIQKQLAQIQADLQWLKKNPR